MKQEYSFRPGTPAILQERTKTICERFFINGLCDPMYIANSIAMITNCGDGCGTFYGDDEDMTYLSKEEAEKCANHLLFAYASNIPESCRQELVEILEHGYINPFLAKKGIREYYRDLKERERKAEMCGDEFNVRYSRKCQKQVLRSKLTRKVIPHAWDECQRICV